MSEAFETSGNRAQKGKKEASGSGKGSRKSTAFISAYQSWEIERDRTAVGQKEKIEEEKEKCRKEKKKTEVRSKKEEKTKEGQGHIKEEGKDKEKESKKKWRT